jgi:tetratricopeptide (TPR) repeat protein
MVDGVPMPVCGIRPGHFTAGSKVSKSKAKRCATAEARSHDLPGKILLPLLLVLVLLHMAAVYWETPHLWGVHHLYFFPRWVAWVLTIATLSLFTAPVNSRVLGFLESVCAGLGSLLHKSKRSLLFAAAGLLSVPVFWFLRTKYLLLGDGYFILDTLSQGTTLPTEWLDGAIHLGFYRLLTAIDPGIDPSLSYIILSVVCGGVFVFLILALSDLLGKTGFQKVLIFSVLATLGSIELFFGYVESYTVLLVSLTLFVLLSVRHLQNRGSLVYPLVAFIFSVGLHVLAIVLTPSFLYLVFRRRPKGNRGWVDTLTALSMLVSIGMICVVIWKIFFHQGVGFGFKRFLPLFPSADAEFGLFSIAHLVEFANELLLISPAGIVLFILLLPYTFRSRSFKDPVLNFLLISSLGGLLLVFVYNCHWGSADWDLMSFPGIFIASLGVLFFIRWGRNRPNFKSYGLILVAVSLYHTIPWILLNADGQKSVSRYQLTVTNDVHLLSTEGGGMWRVARILEFAGFADRAERVLKLGIERDPQELGCYSYLGKMLFSQGRYDEAVYYLKEALRLEPDSPEVQFSLGRVYSKINRLEEAVSHLEEAREEFKGSLIFVVTLSKAYLGTGRPERAGEILEQYLANQESATARGLLGTSFFMRKRFSEARREWERALKLDPNEPLSKSGLEQLEGLTQD